MDRGYPAVPPRRASHSAASRAGAFRRQDSSSSSAIRDAGAAAIRTRSPLSISSGDVALPDLAVGGGVKLPTGVFVPYTDQESVTLMTPQWHMFAGWITFSAERAGEATIVRAHVLMRANDPRYEIGMPAPFHRRTRPAE